MVDTARWWTVVRWRQNAVSLIDRAGKLSPGKTYKLMRALRKHVLNYLDQLWMLTCRRHPLANLSVVLDKNRSSNRTKRSICLGFFCVTPFNRQNELSKQPNNQNCLFGFSVSISGSSLYLPEQGAILYLPKIAPINATEQHGTSRNARVINLMAGSPRSAALRCASLA